MAAPTVPVLRQMEISDVIDAAIRLYRHNFAQLLGIAAIIYVPVMGLQTVVIVELMNAVQNIKGEQIPWAQLSVLGAGLLGAMFLSAILVPLAEGACCIAVSELYLGRKITTVEAYRRVYPNLWRLIWTFFLVGLIVGGATIAGYILCLLPAIPAYLYTYTILLFAWPIVVLEGTWGPDALRRSQYLVKDYFWRILGTIVILGIIAMVLSYAITFPVQMLCLVFLGETRPMVAQAITQSIAMAVTLLVRPVNIISIVLLYYDTRIRKEGFDLQVMAAALGHDPMAYKPAATAVDLPPLWDTGSGSLPPVPPPPGAGAFPPLGAPPEAWVPPPTVNLPPRPGEERLADLPPLPPIDPQPPTTPSQSQQGNEANDAAPDSQSHPPH
jgi:hypothetical protein